MMNYININQKQMVELWMKKLQEWVILDYILKANSWANSVNVEGRTFFEVRVWKIISDLPVLNIWTRALQLSIKTLIDVWLLDKVIQNNKPYYAPTEKTKSYVFSWGGAEVWKILHTKCEKSYTPSAKNISHNSSINNSNIIYTSKEEIKNKNEEVYKLYMSHYPKDKRVFANKGETLKRMSSLSKEFTYEQFMSSAKSYIKSLKDKTYMMAPQYFFSNTPNGKTYRPFAEFIKEQDGENISLEISDLDF